jgi:uncharacterized protein (TIGR03083 family)
MSESTPDSISPSIDHLDETWRSINSLCSNFTDDEWDAPTGCPGWSVKDHLSHLIDYESGAMGRPRPDHAPASVAHTKNALGEGNEIGVDLRRGRPGPEVLEEFREVTVARLDQLRRLGPEDLLRETITPVGTGTVGDMLTLRVMDTWSHEQDIRRAVGRPGHQAGGAAAETVNYFARFLPLIVGKRSGAPDGSAVVMEIDGRHHFPILTEAGRARLDNSFVGAATVTISLSATTFAALVGGRSDAPDDAAIEGDATLGRSVLDHLSFMP